MKFPAIVGPVLLAFAIGPAWAQDCGPLKLFTSIKLITLGNSPLVPVKINGAPKALLLDTGGYMSQLSRDTVDELKMPTHDSVLQLSDVSGNVSRKFTIADTLTLGTLTAQHPPLFISPGKMGAADGILSSDLLLRYDVEMDFPGKKLSYFSPDHCPGKVVYWQSNAVAAVPITIKDKTRLMVPVKLDGQSFDAVIDTGASRTTILAPAAKRVFGLEPNSAGMQRIGNVNGDPNLASYTHVFSSLMFEGITVTNPKVVIMPNRIATADRSQQTGNRARTNGEFFTMPELILGMDVMRHLRMYMAFGEKMLYISPGPPVSDATSRSESLANLDEVLSASPNNPALLNARCWNRGIAKVNLEGALADCELSLKLRSENSQVIDSKAFVLYQMARYEDALAAYNEALKIEPRQAASLFMRGHARRKLGDDIGGAADIAAAKTVNADIQTEFEGSDIN